MTTPTRPWHARFGEVLQALASATTEGTIPRRPFQAPALPPGIVPKNPPRGADGYMALDSGMAQANYGWLNNQPGYCGLGFPGYPYLAELAQRSEYRSPTETIAQEMTREWVNLTGGTEAELKELQQAMLDFGLRECFHDAQVYDGFYGRGQVYIDIKGQNGPRSRKLPLVVDDEGATIKKGSLLGFKAIEPIWTTPYSYNSIDPTQPDFYKPAWWYILGQQTHSSRLLTFISRPVPDILKPAYNFSGMSLSQLIEPYVVRWLKTVDSVNRLLSNFSVSGIATNLQSMLEEDGGGSSLLKRAQLFNQTRDNRGVMLLDKDSEEFFQFNTPLGGLSDLQAQAQEHMAAPTHIPLVKLTGITPAGLNASADGEIKVFYDFIGACQSNHMDGHLRVALRLIQLNLWGKVNPKIKAEWIPLDSPTDKEESEMRKADGDRDTSYVGAGIVSPDEVRARLRMNPKSGYSFLQGQAPAAPLEQEHELGQEAAEADHARGEESAEANAQREADAREHAAKLEPKDKAA
jgi:phage-related protein (TIGR01555 family)